MKRFFTLAIATLCLLAGAVSCSKEESSEAVRYGFDQTQIGQLMYAPGHELDAMVLLSDLVSLENNFKENKFTEKQIIDACDEVANKHNNKYLKGTFSLFKFDIGTNEKISTVKTWTLEMAN